MRRSELIIEHDRENPMDDENLQEEYDIHREFESLEDAILYSEIQADRAAFAGLDVPIDLDDDF